MNRTANHRHVLLLLGLSLLISLITGCGFHLRGSGEALSERYAQTQILGLEGRSILRQSLEPALRAAGVEVVDSRSEAIAVLRFLTVERGQRILTVGTDARVREYELSLAVTFEAHGANAGEAAGEDDPGVWELPAQDVTLTRVLRYDPTGVLSKAQEQERLYEAMEREAAASILYRLRAVSSDDAMAPPARMVD